MEMSGFICHDDYLKKTKRLSDAQLGRVFRALMEYHIDKTEPETLEEVESMAFDFIREDIDRTEKKYADKCEKNRQIRLDAIENERQRSSTDVNGRQQIKENKIKEKEKENKIQPFIDDDNAHGITQEQNTVIDAAEIAGFARNDATRAKLIDLYAVHGLQKMLDAIESCVNYGVCNIAYLTAVLKGEPKKPGKITKVVPAQQYEQRDYSDEQAEAMRRMLALGGA